MRLNAGYAPPHWRASGGDRWDAGYDTTAYFLNWIERRCGKGTVRKLNAYMKDAEYDAQIFVTVTGEQVDTLWSLYCEHLERQ